MSAVTQEAIEATIVPVAAFAAMNLLATQAGELQVDPEDLEDLKDWPVEVRDRLVAQIREDLGAIRAMAASFDIALASFDEPSE